MTSAPVLIRCSLVCLSLTAVLGVGPASTFASEDPAGESEAGLDLRVLSFNIRYGTANDGENRWESRRNLVMAVIRDHSPDIVGIQEALRFQLDEIGKEFPGYQEVGVGRDDGKKKGEYSPVLYRKDRFRLEEQGTFWLSDTPDIPGSRHWGNSIPRICSWTRLVEKSSGIGFYVYNLHLDHQSQPSREKSIGLLRKMIAARKGPEAFVVTGDFNAGEDNPAIREIKGLLTPEAEADEKAGALPGMVDTFRVLHPEAEGVGTFNGFRGRKDGAKIDYVFVPRWVKTEEARILHDNKEGRYPSDHFPVLTRIRVPRVRKS